MVASYGTSDERKDQAINSDVPAGLPKEQSPEKKDLLANLKAIKDEHLEVLYCSKCGELITLLLNGTSKCKNNCTTSQTPIVKIYDPKPGNYRRDFCVVDDFNTPHFKPMMCALFIKDNYLFKIDRATNLLYRYDSRIHKWRTDGDVYLREILGKSLGIEYRMSHYNNTLDALKSITYDDILFGKKIACKNGLLDVTTGQLSKFSPNEMPFYSIPVKYDPDAKCPKWEEFVNQIVAPDDVALLQEWSGYLLYPGYPKHKFMFIYGVGRNGKGVWARTMRGLLGNDNCFSLRLEELNGDHRFVVSRLYGKLFVECSEPLTNKTLQTPILKALTGADNQDAEMKGIQKTIGFTNEGKITIFGNKYPRVNDNTDGFYDRFEILEFPNQFKGENQTDELEKSWLEDDLDRSGILNWMLAGLHRVFTNNKFTTSKTQQQKLIELKRLSDPTGAFIQECCILSPKVWFLRKALREAYDEYCDEIGAIPDKEARFNQIIQNTPRIKVAKKRIAGGQAERIWIGIALKDSTQTPLTAPSNQPTASLMNYSGEATEAAEAGFLPRSNSCNQKIEENRKPASLDSPASVVVDNAPYAPQCSPTAKLKPEDVKEGLCVNFRQPSCAAESWQYINGNESALGKPCFKLPEDGST